MKVVVKENLLRIRLAIHRSGNMDRASRSDSDRPDFPSCCFRAAKVSLLDLYICATRIAGRFFWPEVRVLVKYAAS